MDWVKVLAQFNDLSQSQESIGARYGISQSAMSDLLRKGRMPSMRSMQAIAEVEGKPVWKLVQMAEKFGREHDTRSIA